MNRNTERQRNRDSDQETETDTEIYTVLFISFLSLSSASITCPSFLLHTAYVDAADTYAADANVVADAFHEFWLILTVATTFAS